MGKVVLGIFVGLMIIGLVLLMVANPGPFAWDVLVGIVSGMILGGLIGAGVILSKISGTYTQ